MTRRAIYPGSFDPITNGHIDIIQRAINVFDEVNVVVMNNPNKKGFFPTQRRIDFINAIFKSEPKVNAESYDGLIVDYAKKKDIFTMIRGLRAVSDFDYEFQMAMTNRQLLDKLDTVFFMTDVKYSYLSSSLVQELASFGGNVENFIPQIVLDALKERLV